MRSPPIEPALGWTYISREALARAKAQMDEESMGVRDEIGFLTIHQRYADRFFPGTSPTISPRVRRRCPANGLARPLGSNLGSLVMTLSASLGLASACSAGYRNGFFPTLRHASSSPSLRNSSSGAP